jgi:hypothetical protein
MSLVSRLDKIAATIASPPCVVLIWDMKPDASGRLVGRRKVHTGEVEKVEGWGERFQLVVNSD